MVDLSMGIDRHSVRQAPGVLPEAPTEFRTPLDCCRVTRNHREPLHATM